MWAFIVASAVFPENESNEHYSCSSVFVGEGSPNRVDSFVAWIRSPYTRTTVHGFLCGRERVGVGGLVLSVLLLTQRVTPFPVHQFYPKKELKIRLV